MYTDVVIRPGAYQHNIAIFNPPWLLPILAPWVTMPGRSGFVLFLFLTLITMVVSTRFLKGNPFFVLVSAQLFWILWWGQIEWLAVSGIALAWYAFLKKSWVWMGIAILLTIIKPQLGIFAVIYLWYCSKDRAKSAVLVGFVGLVSLFLWGPWPLWLYEHARMMIADPAHLMWNASIGWRAFPLLILVFILKKAPQQKVLALVAATMLFSPYLPYYSTIPLFCFPLPLWFFVFSILGYFPALLGTDLAFRGYVLFPTLVLVHLYWMEIEWVAAKGWGLGKSFLQKSTKLLQTK